jgi:predicted AAA+ superfamily ATPase
MYPDVLNHRSEAREILLDKLLKALALQLGNEVSYNELSNLLQIDKVTVAKYIDFIEEANG